jgi:hypothetical protein
MKRYIGLLAAAVAAVIFFAGTAFAVPVTFTFTGDNIVSAWYQNGGSPGSLPLDPIASVDWKIADTQNVDLDICQEYQIIWQVVNDEYPGDLDQWPGGFLGQMSSLVPIQGSSLLSSAEWDVYVQYDSHAVPDFSTVSWVSATEYAPNDGSNVWSVVSGIDTNAQWIWGPDNWATANAPGPDDSVFIKANVHPTPEPGTILLLGSGLLGLLGYGVYRKKKS